MPWVDLFKHLDDMPDVTLVASVGESDQGYVFNQPSFAADAQAVLDQVCSPFTSFYPAVDEFSDGGVLAHFYYGSWNRRSVGVLPVQTESNSAALLGLRVRVRAGYTGAGGEYNASQLPAGGALGMTFIDGSGGGWQSNTWSVAIEDLVFPDGFGELAWSEWVEHTITADDFVGGSFAQFLGFGHIANAGPSENAAPLALFHQWQVFVDGPPTISYNCECEDNSGNRTLKQLRDDLARRLGYGAQVNNLPPGMTDLLNSFLQGAQRALYRRYDVLRTERIYAWDLVPGVRYYDLDGNSDTCTKRLDSRKVTWVGVERAGVWYPLICGITPERYSFDQTGQPTRYEIRQCIEIWPGPDSEPAKLRIKGHFELEPFAADTDKTTIDDELVFLMALANAKAHYGKPDAGNYIQQMEVMMANLVAGSHHTRRYIPNTRREGVEAEPRWTVDSWPPP